MALTDDFAGVLARVRLHLKRSDIAVPAAGVWSTTTREGRTELRLTIGAAALSRNLQEASAASPSFLICIAYWLAQLPGTDARVTCRIDVEGEVPVEPTQLRHWRRSRFLLDEFERAMAGRLIVTAPDTWQWPAHPVLNAARAERTTDVHEGSTSEDALERWLCRDDRWAGFPVPVVNVRRQLPVGLFNGAVNSASRWTPAGKSQVDLWGWSPDGTTLHLVELKAGDNRPLGVLPEAFYYARLLHYARAGLPDGRTITTTREDLGAALCAAEQPAMWLIAPAVHPLLLHGGRSPLEWLNDGTRKDHVALGIVPFDGTPRDSSFRWSPERGWP